MGRREHARRLIAKVLREASDEADPDQLAMLIDIRLAREGLYIVPARRWTFEAESEVEAEVERQRGKLETPIPPLSPQLLAVAERDAWVCQICDHPVDPNLRAPHPLAPTRDHILPRSQYSNNDMSNLQLAHRTCNQRKADRVGFKLTHPDGAVREEGAAGTDWYPNVGYDG